VNQLGGENDIVNGWRTRARQRRTPRFAGLIVVLGVIGVCVVGGAAGAGLKWSVAGNLTPDSTFTAAKSSSGYLAQTDPTLLNQSSSSPVSVMIKYDFDATASYTGGVAGLAATSPRETGKSLKANAGAVAAYDHYTSGKSDAISAAVKQAVPAVNIRQTFQTVYGGVEAQIPANSVNALLQVPGVAAVQRDSLQQPLDDNTQFIGATAVWPSLGGSTTAGSNVIVGVIDTGVWPEHPMLTDHGLPATGGSYACQFGSGTDVTHLGAPFVCNNKLIGAYAFTQTYMANLGSDGQEFCNNTTGECSARDPEGHGTHTTTTAAGDCVTNAPLYGVDRGPVCGIAPGAHVIMYRVCMALGCFSSDSVNAVNQAVIDGVNVINYSISGGGNPYTDAVEMAFLDAVNAGISVNASAGNSGPVSGTSDHGGPWVTTVGASTGPRSFTSTLHLTADGGATFDMPGFTLTNGISSPTPVVLAENIPGEDALCQTKLAAGSAAAGKIVACKRGTNARIDKGFNVFSGGAVGMILYNPVAMDVETDNHWLPAIHVDGPSTNLLAFINGHTNVMAWWAQGSATATPADVMAAFSSRGPTGDFIKPDITAPGIQVLAGMTPQPDETTPTNGPPNNLYQAIAGTSMSSPHAAGVSALVKAAHPSWTPEEIKSALMTSSVQAVKKEDGVTAATPFDDGAGSIRADRAVSPTLVFDETYADFVASSGDPLHRVDLNLASIDATTMPGVLTTQRTGINVSGRPQTLDIQTSMPAGVAILVGNNNDPSNAKPLHVGAGGSVTFGVKIDATNVANGQYFGWIKLVPESGANAVFMPVAFVKTQGQVTLTNSCTPATIPASNGTALSHCTTSVSNFAGSPAHVDLSVEALENGKSLKYGNVSPPGVGDSNGVRWSGTLTPAIPPQITSITPTTAANSPGGYFPLSALGVTPLAGVGDDTITNLNVPTFYFGGEPYTRIGVVSNGYLVIGGGTSADVVVTPQHFPNPARPNNVVAPWWTDLNPPAGGAIRATVVADGPPGPTTTTWILVDWNAVKNFGDATTHTFEIWLRLPGGAAGAGAVSEQTTISYGTNSGAGDSASGSNWGAENRDGSSGVNIATQPATGSEYAVNTSPPTAGGTTTLTYDIWAKLAGTYHSVASMTSDLTPGVTQVSQEITVTP
jgi:subtilisin family serine protease